MGIIESMRLDGKKAIVTGGSRGIGKTFAFALAEAGADICIVSTKLSGGQVVADEIMTKHDVKAIAVQADVSKPNDLNRMVEIVLEIFGDIDICVANAGVAIHKPAEEYTLEEWNSVVSVNLSGVFLTDQAVGKVMIKNGKGSIINITSIRAHTASHPNPGCVYPACKAGVHMLTKSLAKEWGKYGVRVNSICPGYMATEIIQKIERNIPTWKAHIPLNRIGNPVELQSALIYLASDVSSYTTGSEVVVDGGYMTM